MRLMRQLSDWLHPDRKDAPPSKHSERSRTYYRALFQATPKWLWDTEFEEQYREVYRQAAAKRAAGEDVHVDHIVPLQHPYVCGLAVPWNLRIVTAKANIAKSNRWWPDCPHENHDLFSTPEQFSLRL